MAIESVDSARAAPDGPNGPNPCALSAHGARGSGCSCAHQFCADTWPYCSMRTFELLGRSWVLDTLRYDYVSSLHSYYASHSYSLVSYN